MISWTGEERQELELSGLLHLRNWKTKLLVIVPCLSDVGMKNSLRLHILRIAVHWSVLLTGWVFKVQVICNLLCNSTSPACLVQHWFSTGFVSSGFLNRPVIILDGENRPRAYLSRGRGLGRPWPFRLWSIQPLKFKRAKHTNPKTFQSVNLFHCLSPKENKPAR